MNTIPEVTVEPVVCPAPSQKDLDYFVRYKVDPKIARRITVERAIYRRAVQVLIEAGYSLRVYDGEEYTTPRTQDLFLIEDAAFSTDEESLVVYQGDTGPRIGSVYFVYGNDGWDVVSDHSVSLTAALQPVTDYADALETLRCC